MCLEEKFMNYEFCRISRSHSQVEEERSWLCEKKSRSWPVFVTSWRKGCFHMQMIFVSIIGSMCWSSQDHSNIETGTAMSYRVGRFVEYENCKIWALNKKNAKRIARSRKQYHLLKQCDWWMDGRTDGRVDGLMGHHVIKSLSQYSNITMPLCMLDARAFFHIHRPPFQTPG